MVTVTSHASAPKSTMSKTPYVGVTHTDNNIDIWTRTFTYAAILRRYSLQQAMSPRAR